MHEAIERMISRYPLQSTEDAVQALREILQQAALLGLWRARFFEHAAFYGGTALRIVHGLDRFSEDLDFTLIRPDADFLWERFLPGVQSELEALGFSVSLARKEKSRRSGMQSAFLKTDTRAYLLSVTSTTAYVDSIAPGSTLRIRLELDVTPPMMCRTEMRYLFQPIPFAIRCCVPSTLFAGKMHAVLCRGWRNRVKGRDWYDFLWFVANNVPLDLEQLDARLRASGHREIMEELTPDEVLLRLRERIEDISVEQLRSEVRPFLRRPDSTDAWSKELFHAAASALRFMERR